MDLLTVASFLVFTALVAVLTWLITRNDDHESSTGYFLAGRSLSFPLIAGSLLLTNLSTEQMVGLNGDAYKYGLSVMVWEVVCVVALVFMAWFFLPKFLKSGVATVPEYLGLRFDDGTRMYADTIFLFAYVLILLPVILYSGAAGLMNMLDINSMVAPLAQSFAEPGNAAELEGMERTLGLWITVASVGILGACYALWGGLKTVAVSDTLNGVGLLIGGLLVTYFALTALPGATGVWNGLEILWEDQRERFNSVGAIPEMAAADVGGTTYQVTRTDTNVPFGAIFSGIFLLNLFYWTTNQQIIQRTFAASSLAEGQKGVLLTGALKLLGPLYLVLPGMIAFSYFAGAAEAPASSNDAFGLLVKNVLPPYLTGFFAAVMVGAILSSFNSALNSTCTLFSLGFYKKLINPGASDHQQVRAGAIFGVILTICSICLAPQLDKYESIFNYLQTMNSIYFIPIFAVVLVGMLTRRVSAAAAKVSLTFSLLLLILGNFVPPFTYIVGSMHNFHFIGVVFAWTVILLLVLGEVWPRQDEYIQVDVKAVDMTPWKGAPMAGCLLIAAVFAIYITFANFGVLAPKGSPLPADSKVTEERREEIEKQYNATIEEETNKFLDAVEAAEARAREAAASGMSESTQEAGQE